MDSYEDEEESAFEGLYEDGHWEWNEKELGLIFISDAPSREESILRTMVCGPIQFRDDIDVLEQQRYKKRFQRKSEGENDVVTLQDVKDLVLYTAPMTILTKSVINMLHLHATERYLRALILYMQYFIQISDLMNNRALEQQTKVRTPTSDDIEMEYRENLQDLRLLVTKEYCYMVTGGGEFRKYHHMGQAKKMRSLARTDSLFYEAFIQLSVQIVWIALARKAYNQIELEVNRLFRSRRFNLIDHKRGINSVARLTPQERFVLLGHSVHLDYALHTRSPLLREVRCGLYREVDYRLLGLGVIEFSDLPTRLLYMERALVTPEIQLLERYSMTLGIVGLKRSHFDSMLKEIKQPASIASGSNSTGRSSRLSRVSTTRKSTAFYYEIKLYPDVRIPEKYSDLAQLPDSFPQKTHTHGSGSVWCSDRQRQKWLARLAKFNVAWSKKHTHAH